MTRSVLRFLILAPTAIVGAIVLLILIAHSRESSIERSILQVLTVGGAVGLLVVAVLGPATAPRTPRRR